MYAAFVTLSMVGLRRGELLGLRWQDVDSHEGVVHVRQTLARIYNHNANRLHDARYTYATWMLEQGEHPKVVSDMLGHSSIKVTLDVYSHVSLELQKQAASRLNAALTGRQ